GTDVVAATLSGDGRTLMVARTTGSGASAVSKVYVSKAGAFADLGTTASLVNASGFQSFTPPGGQTAGSWLSLAASYDGTRLTAGGYHYLGSVFTSDNGGHSWVEEKSAERKPASSAVASDADGWQVYKGNGLPDGVVQVSRGPGDGGDNYTDFAIQYTDQNPANPGFDESSWTLFAHTPSKDLSRVVTGLEPDTLYWFRVAQVNPQGQGAWSGPVSARTFVGSSAPGGVPQDLAALGGDREASVSWSAAVRLWSGLAGVPGAVTASATPW
ncbi:MULTISPECIES: fibronectin type III domain-containing protein, partial [unclassified Leucobacter]|uniref:fibronectin type III domain-containing protein n=1 Tax=unclassified Leucobacter TaxID=2621730 RepID=UPI0030160D68